MKFNEYMKTQDYKLKEDEKLLIFDDIKDKIQKESIFQKFFIYSKVSVYGFIIIFVFFSIFVYNNPKNLENKNKGNENDEKIFVENKVNQVVANYIGKVIESHGEFKIMDENKRKYQKQINKGNTLYLSKNSNITLQVNDEINLYLVGPAKIKLDYYKNNEGNKIYTLNMLDGDYLTVKSNLLKDKIIFKSDLLNIESNDKFIDIKYEKKGNAMIVENNGGDILVKDKKNIYSIKKKEKLILGEENVKEIIDIFEDNYKKYQVNSLGKVKLMLKSDNLEKLSNILEYKNTKVAVGRYVLGKINKDKDWENEGKEQLLKIINNTYNLFNIKKPKLLAKKIENEDVSIVELQNLVDNLITEINKKYIVLEKYTNRLNVILSYLVIAEKINLKEGEKFKKLSSLIEYIKIDQKYKYILNKF